MKHKKDKLTFGSLEIGDIFIDMKDLTPYIKIEINSYEFLPSGINLYTGDRECFRNDYPVKKYKRKLVFNEEDFE